MSSVGNLNDDAQQLWITIKYPAEKNTAEVTESIQITCTQKKYPAQSAPSNIRQLHPNPISPIPNRAQKTSFSSRADPHRSIRFPPSRCILFYFIYLLFRPNGIRRISSHLTEFLFPSSTAYRVFPYLATSHILFPKFSIPTRTDRHSSRSCTCACAWLQSTHIHPSPVL